MIELDLGSVLERDRHRVGLQLRGRRSGRRPAGLSPLVVVVLAWRIGGGEGTRDGRVIVVPQHLRGVGAELAHRLDERRLRLGERDPVLRALRARDARLDLAEVELERLGEGRLLRALGVKEALLAGVGVDQLDQLGGPPRELEVTQRLGVDREDRAGRAELRRHVADRRPVGEPERVQPRPEELDELAHHASLPEHLGHGQHQVGGGRALGQLPAELEADDLREQHRDRLAEHRRLGLDSAHAPAQHAKPVDHRRVGVGADQRVGIGTPILRRRPPDRDIPGSPGGRSRWPAEPRAGCRTPAAPSAGTRIARRCAGSRGRR